MVRLHLFIGFISVLNTFFASAQAIKELGTPFITNYKSGEDIFDSQYWCAVQDHRGVMYFGASTGIVEFDGIEHKLIATPNGTLIRALCAASDSVIYAGGENIFGYLAYTDNGETVFVSLVNKLKKEHRDFNSVVRIFHTDNTTWFLTESGGVFKLKNDSLTVLQHTLFSRFGATAYGKLFLFQHNRGIYVIENDKPQYLPHTRQFLKSDVGKIELLPFGKNELLIVTKNKGLYLYHYDELLKRDQPCSEENISAAVVEKFETEIEEYLIQNIVYPCTRIDSTQYVFGTLLGGIIIMNDEGKLVRVINENRGLYDNIIYGLYVDRNKDLWALMNNGVSYVNMNSPISSFNKDNKLGKLLFHAKEHKGRLYLAHEKGISYLPEYSLKINNDDHGFVPVKGIKGMVSNFYPYKDIVFCEADGKLYIIYQAEAKVLTGSSPVHSLIPSSKFNNTFFYCSQAGLGYFQISYRSNKDFPEVTLKKLKNFDTLPVCNWITEDPQGNILLSSIYNGFYHIRFSNTSIDDYRIVKYDTTHGLPSTTQSGFITYNDNVFIGSPQGLLQAKTFPERSFCCDSITAFIPETYFRDKLADSSLVIHNVNMTASNQLWLDTNKGSGLITTKEDGTSSWKKIPLRDISPGTVNMDHDGIYWIASRGVLYRFDPFIKSSSVVFHVLIRKITIGSDSVIFDGSYVSPAFKKNNYYLKSKLHQPEQPAKKFAFTSNSIKFECAATSYDAVRNNQYSYFLEGVDKNWSEWSSKSKQEYSYLPAGNYTFRVKAMNVHGHESAEAVYTFEILPPWYKTIAAYASYLVLGLLIISGGVRLYYNRLVQSKRRLEKVIDERTREIREKNIQLSNTVQELQELQNFKESMIHMIVHDLKNPLNTIIAFGREKQAANMNSFILHSGKTMMNMVENILNVHKFEESKIKLKVETAEIRQVISEAIGEVSFIACERKIRIAEKTVPQTFLFDVELIKRVLVNLLSNAIKFSPDEHEVLVECCIQNENRKNFMRIAIRDHGTGIPPEMTDKIFDKYVQLEARKLGIAHSTGLGLTFCKLVVEAHKGRIAVEPGHGKGSVFYFVLPIV